jgi:peptidoglycan/xylan/chitin deacetylase (PgdA/CDA1 family)
LAQRRSHPRSWWQIKKTGERKMTDRREFLAASAGIAAAVTLSSSASARPKAGGGVRGDPRMKMVLPNNAKIVFTVVGAFEVHPTGGNFGTKGGKPTQASKSYSKYAYDVGIWRILEMMDRHSLKGSFSTNGQAAKENPRAIRAMIENGHECYGHGWAQGIDTGDKETERKQIRDTVSAIADGGGERPVGWAGPGSQSSEHTLDLMIEEGFTWNGDDASNDIPFLRKVAGKTLAILPRINFQTNDLIAVHSPANPPGVLFDNFKDIFDTLYEEGKQGRPQWIELLVHCDIGSRPPYAGPFQRAVEYAKGFDGVWQTRRRDLADWTLKTQRLPA